MDDWNGTTSFSRDLLNRIVKVTDHDGKTVEYGWDAVGNKTVQGYPDGSQVDYYYDAENQIVEVVDFDGGITKYEYDANGNKIFKEYPNYETSYYFYDACDQIIEMDEYDLGGKKLFKTTYSWDAEGNRLSEMQYNHGQSSGKSLLEAGEPDTETQAESETEKKGVFESIGDWVQGLFGGQEEAEVPSVQLAEPDTESLSTSSSIVNGVELPDATANTAAGLFLTSQAETAEDTNAALMEQLNAAEELNESNAGEEGTEEAGDTSESSKPETGKDDATVEGNGDGNGQVPPGQEEDEDGNIVNPGGHMPPGLNRGKKGEKPDNPNKPDKPENPGTEDKDDKNANKGSKGTHLYEYDELNRMTSSNIAKTETTYTYDTLGNLVLEETKNKGVDYQYNELNQLISKKDGNESYTYTYDKRGNRIAETGKKESRTYVYDETNRLVEGTNWKGDKSSYTYNGLGIRINNTQTTHAGQVYSRDYVIDYTSYENDDLMVFAYSGETVEYEQKQVYAGSERIEQYTDKGDWERLLYVHEDVMGNTRYYTKENGQSFAELTYDAWGMPESPNKLLNNDHGNFVYATFTGHIYDTTLDIYFAEARFYDAANRTWMAVDPVKDGLNWYQYCYGNPTTYWDPLGLAGWILEGVGSKFAKATCEAHRNILRGMSWTEFIHYIGADAGIASVMNEFYLNGGDPEDIIALMKAHYGESSRELLKSQEGLWETAVRSGDVYSIGYGSDFTKESDPDLYEKYVLKGQKITPEEASELLDRKVEDYVIALDDFIETNDLEFNQNQYDALLSYFYNNGAYVFSQTAYDSWIDQGGEKAKRAKARKELKEYLINNKGNYDDDTIVELFVNSKGPSLKYDVEYVGRRTEEALLFNK